jgi:hypothetical protein
MNKRHLLASAVIIGMLPGLAVAEMTLTRIATMPDGAEVTGISTNAIGDLFLNAQHPAGKNTLKDDAPAALVGYVAGFGPSAPTMAIPAEDARTGVSTNSGEYVTFAKWGYLRQRADIWWRVQCGWRIDVLLEHSGL